MVESDEVFNDESYTEVIANEKTVRTDRPKVEAYAMPDPMIPRIESNGKILIQRVTP